MRITNTTLLLLCFLITIASCSKNDETPLELQLTVGSSKYDLSNAFIYLDEEYDEDKVDDESSDNTHHFVRLYVTDGAFTTECPSETYLFYINFWYPINDGASGMYSLNVNTWTKSTRYTYVTGYYDLSEGSTDCFWPNPYKQWGSFNNPAPNGSIKIKTGSNGLLTISMGKYLWESATSTPEGWVFGDDVFVSFGVKGKLIE